MTTETKLVEDIELLLWPDIRSADLRSVFRNRSHWVIDAPKSSPVWYSAVLSNLLCHYIHREPASIDVVRSVLQSGLSRSAFDRLKMVADLTTNDLSRVINVSLRTLARRDKFRQDESERLLRVASAFQRTLEVFSDIGKARRWFSSPKRALGGNTPLEFCDTGPGAEEVEHLLGRIATGVFS